VQPFIAQRKLTKAIFFNREDFDVVTERLEDINVEANSSLLTLRLVPNVAVISNELPYRFHNISKDGIIPKLNRKPRDMNPLSCRGNFMGERIKERLTRN